MKTLNLASTWQGEILNTHGLLTSNTSTTKYIMTAQNIPKHFLSKRFCWPALYKKIEYPLKGHKNILD